MAKQLYSRVILVIIIAIAAFLAAFIGQIVITSLSDIPSLLPNDSLIIRQESSPLLKLEKARDTILSNQMSGLVQFYQVIDNSLNLVGNGLILTNDGWMVGVFVENPGYVRLDSGELIKIEETVADPSTSLVFVKVEATDLHPVTMGSDISTTPFQSYLAVQYRGAIIRSDVIAEELAVINNLSSDKLARFTVMTAGDLGDLIYDQRAEVVGMVVNRDNEFRSQVVKISIVREALQIILKNKALIRPSLGVTYIDLAHQAILAEELENGALVTKATRQFRLNDIIISVDNQQIDRYNSLSDYVLRYKPADTVELEVLRGEKTLFVDVTLI